MSETQLPSQPDEAALRCLEQVQDVGGQPPASPEFFPDPPTRPPTPEQPVPEDWEYSDDEHPPEMPRAYRKRIQFTEKPMSLQVLAEVARLDMERRRVEERQRELRRDYTILSDSEEDPPAPFLPPKRTLPNPGGRPKKARTEKPFQVRQQVVPFTVPQCAVPPEEFYRLLCAKSANIAHAKVYIVRELHKNGDPHLHGLIIADKRYRLQFSNHIPDGPTEWVMNISTNWQKYKDKEKGWMKYMLKEEPTVEKGTLFMSPGVTLESLDDEPEANDYTMISRATSEQEALVWLQAAHGNQFLRYAGNVLTIFRAINPRDEYIAPGPLNPAWANAGYDHRLDLLRRWIATYVTDQGWRVEGARKPVFLLTGGSNLGKTVALRSLLKDSLVYCNRMVTVAALTTKSVASEAPLVLDDLLDGLPGSEDTAPEKAWTQTVPYVTTCKYVKRTTVANNRPVVIICNQVSWLNLNPYWQRPENLWHLDITSKLF